MKLSPLVSWEAARESACRVAIEAWEEAIRPLFHADYQVTEKEEGPCTEADRRADRLIVERLRQLYPEPDYGYLTEESEDNLDRLACRRVWIIDPIDGTKEFMKKSENFAVHVGLVERLDDGQWHPVASAVFQPIPRKLYSAVRGQGAFCRIVPEGGLEANGTADFGRRLGVSERGRISEMRSVVSNAHDKSRTMRLIKSLELEEYWRVGSLGVKLCTIAEGEAELYINIGLGKAKEWDTCAPHLVLSEAGGCITDLSGQPITYNRERVYHDQGLLASNALIHADLLGVVNHFLVNNEH